MSQSKARRGDSLFSLEQLESRRLLSVSQDDNGFTIVSPSPDTRKIYVSSSIGNDNNLGLLPVSPVKTIAKAESLLRDGMPDWLLLRRGDTFQESLGQWVKSGRSADEPMLVSAYGQGNRPLLETGSNNGIFTQNEAINSLAIIGLSFHATSSSAYGIFWLSPTSSLLIEDSSFDDYGDGMVLEGNGIRNNVTIRRDVITDSSGLGIYTDQLNNLLIEENVLDHNGWNAAYGSVPTVRKHGIYIKETCTNVIVRGNIIANSSSHGLQARSGGIVENNLFLNNPIGMSFGYVNGSPITPGGVSGRISGNVFLGSRDISGSPRGWAMEISNTKPGGGTLISNNIIAHDTQQTPNTAAIWLSYGSDVTNVAQAVGINDLTIEKNIVYDWYSALGLNAGLVPGGVGATALNGLTIRNNDFSQMISSLIVEHDSPFGPLAESWQGNTYSDDSNTAGWFSPQSISTSLATWMSKVDPMASSLAPGYADPSRNIARYNASLGGIASDDAFITQARLQSRSNWRPAYTARAAIDYVQQGFATHAVLVTPSSALQTTESGGTATFQVVLSTQPAANVLVPISSNNTAEASVSSSLLTFTPANWNVAQTVTVTGIDDNAIDQDVTYKVIIAASQSTDANYNGLDATDLTLVNKALVPTITLGGLALGLEASP